MLNKVGKHKTSITKREIWTKMEQTVVTYHDTDVVKFTIYEIELDSGGFSTPTTKLRMNQASHEFGLGFRVWQERFTWYVEYKGRTREYKDHMILKRS